MPPVLSCVLCVIFVTFVLKQLHGYPLLFGQAALLILLAATAWAGIVASDFRAA